jgi:hypothetical protein
MTRAVALLVLAAALTLVAAPGCQRSSGGSDPKVDLKDKPPPIQPMQPAGAPGGKAVKQGAAPGSQ